MTPVPQRNIDTFGGGSIPKNPDPVAAFKERLKEKVLELNNQASQTVDKFRDAGNDALADKYCGEMSACQKILTLINETK